MTEPRKIDLPERVIDVLVGQFNLHSTNIRWHERLYAFAHALKDEALARLPSTDRHLTLTKRPGGELVAVTWQDEEGHILETVWEKQKPDPVWKPIDQAPRDGTEVVLVRWFKEGGYRRIDVGHWDIVDQDSWEEGGKVHYGWSTEGESFLDDEPTHFMLVDAPVPTPEEVAHG